MRKLIEYIAKSLVDDPAAVQVREVRNDRNVLALELHVAPDDFGKVIGRQGRVLDDVYVGPNYTRHLIQSARPYKGEMIVLKLVGIDDANAAESLRNQEICIPLSKLAKLPSDSYYQHDILGLHAFTLDGRELGTIVDIFVTGGNDVYVIKAPDGSQILIPAIKDVIKQIDLIHHVMYIDPLPGLLDNVDEEQREEEEKL